MTKLLAIGLTGLLASACVPSAPPTWLVGPTDPQVGGRSPRYVSVTSGVKRFGVVETKDWRELNRAAGPNAGNGAGMPGMDMGSRDMGGRR